MQIIFTVSNPRPITGTFIYLRSNNGNNSNLDDIDAALLSWTMRLSSSFSHEPYLIETFPNIVTNEIQSTYNSTKQIEVIFRCFEIRENKLSLDKEKESLVTVYFDTADKQFLDTRITTTQFIALSKECFEKLETLIIS